MNQELETLLQLQSIDLRIREQELAQEQYPAAVADLEQGIAKAKTALDNASAKLTKAESEKKAFEDQIAKTRESLEKSQERLNSIKTNREYDAVHAEIETQKHMMSTAEAKQRKLAEDVDRIHAIVEENQRTFDAIKSDNEPQIADFKSKIGSIDSTIAEIAKERDVILPKISKQYLRTYDNIRNKRKNGKALSIVSNSRTCAICHKVLEPQLLNEIKRGLKMILCQSCGSILLWQENTTK
jgi:predicted  nucleic acid-binding Zn-ribbon protein